MVIDSLTTVLPRSMICIYYIRKKKYLCFEGLESACDIDLSGKETKLRIYDIFFMTGAILWVP